MSYIFCDLLWTLDLIPVEPSQKDLNPETWHTQAIIAIAYLSKVD